MSVVAIGGQFAVLDQVNNRVTLWDKDGKAQVKLPLKVGYAADIALGENGSVAVLDRLVDKEVSLYDKEGNRIGGFALEGEAVGDPGKVTGVYVEGEQVYVEKEHGPLVPVGNLKGERASQQEELPGRPSRDGALLLSAGISDQAMGKVYVAAFDRKAQQSRFTRLLTHAGMAMSIVGLDSDKAGTIYLAVELDQGSAHPTIVTCLEPRRGTPIGAVEIPTNTTADETLKELTVTDDGTIIFAHRLEEGMAFESYRCP